MLRSQGCATFPSFDRSCPTCVEYAQEAQQPSSVGPGEDPNGDKATPEGQVRVPFLEETAAGKVLTLALATLFP